VSEEDLDVMSSRLKMEFKKYVEQTIEALTTVPDTEVFQYQLTTDDSGIEFAWKKHVPAEGITVGIYVSLVVDVYYVFIRLIFRLQTLLVILLLN